MAVETIILNIDGMVCDACAGHVARALLGVPGVADARVSLLNGKAYVSLDGTRATLDDLKRAVVDDGYKALPAAAF